MTQIRKAQVELLAGGQQNLTVWFTDSDEPFSSSEFVKGSKTRQALDNLECAITDMVETVNLVLAANIILTEEPKKP